MAKNQWKHIDAQRLKCRCYKYHDFMSLSFTVNGDLIIQSAAWKCQSELIIVLCDANGGLKFSYEADHDEI